MLRVINGKSIVSKFDVALISLVSPYSLLAIVSAKTSRELRSNFEQGLLGALNNAHGTPRDGQV